MHLSVTQSPPARAGIAASAAGTATKERKMNEPEPDLILWAPHHPPVMMESQATLSSLVLHQTFCSFALSLSLSHSTSSSDVSMAKGWGERGAAAAGIIYRYRHEVTFLLLLSSHLMIPSHSSSSRWSGKRRRKIEVARCARSICVGRLNLSKLRLNLNVSTTMGDPYLSIILVYRQK